ncbi:MAG: hypothetical protein ACXADL_07485 [Candidatus Thorarchaeota archaeon]
MNIVVNQYIPLQGEINFHMTIILGLPAIILLLIGTLLYQISREKYTFAHGMCAGLSLLLTTINIVTILPMTGTVLSIGGIDLFHLIHIILGVIGYLFGVGAFLTGISGIRTKVPGLVALVCWTVVFVMGYIQFLM